MQQSHNTKGHSTMSMDHTELAFYFSLQHCAVVIVAPLMGQLLKMEYTTSAPPGRRK